MIKDLENFPRQITSLKRDWDNPLVPALLLAAVLVGGGVLAYKIDIYGLQAEISFAEGLLVVGICLLVLAIWFVTSRPRKTLPGKIGIMVAIVCESESEEVRLRADFVDALRDRVTQTNRRHFEVFELSPYNSSRCQSPEDAIRYLKKTKSHLLIFGRCRLRNYKGKLSYMVDFQEVVRHAPVPDEVSQQLKQDMQLAFPTRMLFP